MHKILFAALVAAAALSSAGCSTLAEQETAPMIARGDVMETSSRLSERYAAAWNKNDMAQFGALYAPDARHVNGSGEFLRGRSAIVSRHRANRVNYAPSVRMVAVLEGARAITDDTIVAVVRLEIVNDPAKPSAVQPTRVTFTLARRGDEWLIAQAHDSHLG